MTASRAGSVHVATIAASGRGWAVASFRLRPGPTGSVRVRAQDGGASAIFTRRGPGRPWTQVATGVAPLACDAIVPAAVRSAWRLAPAVRCGGAPRAAISHALTLARHDAAAGSLGDRIASIALSQVGESDEPVSTSFGLDCDPYTTLDGPPDAAPSDRGCEFDDHFGVENENEEWCADFADWVWQRAGVTEDMGLINPGAMSFYGWGAAQGETLTVDGTDPQVGDAVVFYEPGAVTASTSADHVGIVSAVNADGTVDLVDGDFDGPQNIGVQYAAHVDLATWASQVWSPGEQWVFVSPPTGAQPPIPTATVSGPHVVAAGTEATFHATGAESGGTISSDAWSFGEGNGVAGDDPTATTVHHVFADPGRTTVTMIETSSRHTITVRTFDVDVVTPSSTVASTPSDAIYYNDGPVSQRLFSVDGSGALTEESFDGASWLDEALPGSWSPGTPVTTVDDKVDGTLTPHVIGRSATGTLQQAVLSGTAWTVQALPGSPAPGSPIVATDVAPAGADGSTPTYPAIFFRDSAGRLVESSAPSGSWVTSVLPVPRGGHGLALGTVESAGVPALTLYTRSWDGGVLALTQRGRWWTVSRVASRWQVAARSGLAAVDSGSPGDPGVFFEDRAGRVIAAAPGPFGAWWRTSVVSSQASRPDAGLQAGEEATAAGSAVDEVATVSRGGAPQLITDANGAWRQQTLPGSAEQLLGLGAYPVPGSPDTVLTASAQGIQADTAATATGPWTATTLPSSVASFPDRVVLYAADAGDLAVARGAAQQAGLPAAQVTGSFDTAWADGVSGDYLVITVGGPATSALYFNACGWSNPSGAVPGSTPFSNLTTPTDALPGPDEFLQADGTTAAGTQSLADDLADDAAHGSLPPGVTTLPTQAQPADACAGSPDVS